MRSSLHIKQRTQYFRITTANFSGVEYFSGVCTRLQGKCENVGLNHLISYAYLCDCICHICLPSASGVFDAAQYETGGELWELAWAVIDAFYPELRAEMWPSQQQPADGSGSGASGAQA